MSRQTRLVELQRRIKIAVDALRSAERALARELGSGTSSAPTADELAERIKNATKAAVSSGKDH
jgi:glycosyltransferase A (GT-A) superfamily protein (DUF2064 family)